MSQQLKEQNLETRLFKPVDLIPGIGFLTSLKKILEYNSETAAIREGTIQSTESPDSRGIKSTLAGGLSTVYHVATLTALGTFFHAGEKIIYFVDKLV